MNPLRYFLALWPQSCRGALKNGISRQEDSHPLRGLMTGISGDAGAKIHYGLMQDFGFPICQINLVGPC